MLLDTTVANSVYSLHKARYIRIFGSQFHCFHTFSPYTALIFRSEKPAADFKCAVVKQDTCHPDSADEAERDDKREDPVIPDEEKTRLLDNDETNEKDGKYIDFALYCYSRQIKFQREKNQDKYIF